MSKNALTEIMIYSVSLVSTLFITGFAVHMFVGGMVSQETEYRVIAAACIMVLCATAYMAWDVIQTRSGKK